MKGNELKLFLKKNTGTILTVSSCICTGLTAYFGIQAGLKLANMDTDDKKEIAKTVVPVSIAAVGSMSLGIAADISNRKVITSLADTCILAGLGYASYREEVRDRYGAEVDADILATTVCGSSTYHCTDMDIPDKKCHWVFNSHVSGMPAFGLDAYERDIIHAEYHFNRNYVLMAEATIGDLVTMLGCKNKNLDDIPNIHNFGWRIDDDEIYFVDFEHREILPNDGMQTFEIIPVFLPKNLEEDY